MWRYLVGGLAALAMGAAGVLLFSGRGAPGASLLASPPPVQTGAEPLPDAAPEASERTREEKRFGRYDKDRDGRITRDEYLASRRKAYAKLDLDGDGRLSFDEWSAKTQTRFANADADKSGAMSPVEFATTAPKRRPASKAKCPPGEAVSREEEGA